MKGGALWPLFFVRKTLELRTKNAIIRARFVVRESAKLLAQLRKQSIARHYPFSVKFAVLFFTGGLQGSARMKTFTAKPQTVRRDWYVVDAAGQTLGRLCSEIAARLRGKHKPEYTPHVDTGDYIVVINAEQIRVTGNKSANKTYYSHSGFPGGIKEIGFEKLLARAPERIIEIAVKGMLPKNPLGRDMYRKLKVYKGSEHPHGAQQPQVLTI